MTTSPSNRSQKFAYLRSHAELVPVISCAVFDSAERRRLLLGVRRNIANSPRHPGVLSTMTMRLPWEFFSAIADPFDIDPDAAGVYPILDAQRMTVGSNTSNSDCLLYCVESLLTRKLGLADHLAMGRFAAIARVEALAIDEVADPQGGGDAEWTAMLTVTTDVTLGAELIPSETGAYSRLIWGEADKVGAAYRSHDALLLDDSLDPIEVCIAGLCIRSAVDVIGPAGN